MPLIDPVMMSGTTAQTIVVKPSLPIELLPNDLASIFTNVHPILLLSIFYLRFPALVADPTSTLLVDLAPLAVIQLLYAVICLPPIGSSSAKPAKKVKGSTPKKSPVGSAILTGIIAALLSLISIPAIFTTQILFGAPITTHLPHTILTSAHIALLSVFPLIYVHGYDGKKWREVISIYSPIDEVFGASVGALFGAWVGAVPIPLDWDREWQKWPVTIITGAYAGYVLGKLAGGWLFKGKRIELE